jgi:hypothetical protein
MNDHIESGNITNGVLSVKYRGNNEENWYEMKCPLSGISCGLQCPFFEGYEIDDNDNVIVKLCGGRELYFTSGQFYWDLNIYEQ